MTAPIDALCCRCGAIRQVSRGAATVSHNRPLKCSNCNALTMHALVLPRGGDEWRERANRAGEDVDSLYDRKGTQPPINRKAER